MHRSDPARGDGDCLGMTADHVQWYKAVRVSDSGGKLSWSAQRQQVSQLMPRAPRSSELARCEKVFRTPEWQDKQASLCLNFKVPSWVLS